MNGDWTHEEESALYEVLRNSAQDTQISNPVIWDDLLEITGILTYGFDNFFYIEQSET